MFNLAGLYWQQFKAFILLGVGLGIGVWVWVLRWRLRQERDKAEKALNYGKMQSHLLRAMNKKKQLKENYEQSKENFRNRFPSQ